MTLINNGNRQAAWIFDVDGTLAHMGDRSPYAEQEAWKDTPNVPVITCLRLLRQDGFKIIICSGRDEGRGRNVLEGWLNKHDIGYDELFMRPAKNMEKDSIIKERIYNQNIKDHYIVMGVFDDRNQVVDKWRELGLPCFQVAPGNF